jgi:predicted nucleotidyltransferase
VKNEMVEKLAEGLSKFQEVEVGYVFGSFLTGKFTDIDVALLLPKALPPHESMRFAMRVARTLEKALEHRFEFDVKILNSSPIYFRHEVIKNGEVVFCRDEAKRIEYEAGVLSEYLDYRDVLEWFDEKLLARA